MGLIGILIGIFILVTFFMPWVNHCRFGPLREEMTDIRRDIKILQRKLSLLEGSARISEPAREPEKPRSGAPILEEAGRLDAEPEFKPSPKREPVSIPSRPQIAAQRIQETGRSNFELNIGTKLPVWIGAISLICAAFFLVKYSIESGWLNPVVRVGLGVAFGSGLVVAGQWVIRHTGIANYERIAQGLVGAGLVSLYVSLYAAVSLYGLLPPLIGFGAMTAVTALAVILSLRHGQPIAAFGLLGGLLTPALVGSPEPSAMILFAYLFLLFGGMLFILARKGWWTLAAMALVGVFLWTGFWYYAAFASGDALVLVLFAVAICGAVLETTKSYVLKQEKSATENLSVHSLNIIAIAGGALTIIWLSVKISLSLFDWSMLGLLSLGCIGLTYFRPAIYQQFLRVKLVADLVLFFMWAHNVPLADATIVIAGMAAVYIALPYLIMRRVHDPRSWAGMQFVTSIALYVISYYRIELPGGFAEHGFWGIAALVLAGLSVYQAKEMRLKYHADEIIQDHLTAMYALAATSFISLGLSIEMPREYLPLAFAAQTMATMWVYSRTGIDVLKKIALILTGVFIALNYEQLALFGGLSLSSMFGELPSRHLVSSAMLDMPLVRLGLPALFIGMTSLIYRRQDNPGNCLSHVLFGTTLTLVLAAGYYSVRDLFQISPDFFILQAGFLERGVVTLMIAASGLAVIAYAHHTGAEFIKIWGRSLFHLAMLRIVWFDLLILNPYAHSHQFVGDLPLFNGVTLTYGTGMALAAWAVYSQTWGRGAVFIKTAYKLLGFAILLSLSSLTVRQYFHGGWMAAGSLGHAEFYSYSVAWLLTGLGLLAFGIVRQNKTARTASLAFMLLTIGKVFLFDAAELEGLYRVFSFLGLGMSLIGLSYFYTRFILGSEEPKEKDTGPWWF